ILTELTTFLFPWLVFLTIIIITKENGHIAVNYFFNKLPNKFQKYAAIFNILVMLTFSIFMMISSYKLAADVYNILIPIIDISRTWLYVSMFIAFFSCTIILILQLIKLIKYGPSGPFGDENNDLDYDN